MPREYKLITAGKFTSVFSTIASSSSVTSSKGIPL
jgi:hypothetical protein